MPKRHIWLCKSAILKLQRKGVGCAVYFWLQKFLLNRRIRTKVNANYQPFKTKGCPRDLLSGAFSLFIVYVDDLLDVIHSNCALYDDDVQVLEELCTRHWKAVRFCSGLALNTEDIVSSVMAFIEPLELSLYRAMTLSYVRFLCLPVSNLMQDMVDQLTHEHLLQQLQRRTWVEMAEYFQDQMFEPLSFHGVILYLPY